MVTGVMASGWYFLKRGAPAEQQVGPLSWEQIYSRGRSGAFGPDDLVWNPQLTNWLPAARIPGLFPAPVPASAANPAATQSYAPPQQYATPQAARRRPAWLLPVIISLVAVIIVGGGVGSFLALRGGSDSLLPDGIDGTIPTETSTVATTEAPGGEDTVGGGMGTAEVADADPASVVESAAYGPAPANQVLVLMAEGSSREDAEVVAAQIGGSVVGEIEYIGMYQIQTAGTTAQDLEAAIAAAAAIPGVDSASPNGVTVVKSPLEGKKCSPLRDPMYEAGDNSAAYDMIGTQEAWDILKASGVELSDAHVGIVDSVVYTNSGQDFGTELNFPDADGNYPEGKTKVRGLGANDTTNQPNPSPKSGGLTHGTQVAHIIGADPGNGATGVAGVLGDKLTMTLSQTTGVGGAWTWQAANVDPADATQYQGFYVRSLVNMQKQVESGATVINLSIGPDRPEAGNAWGAAAYKRFFEKMAKDHPNVLFVAAAGNENGGLDGKNYGPGGFKLPNVITVGALDHSGDRATPSDWIDPAKIQAAYDARKAAGTIPADQTLEQFTDSLQTGSNYATGDGEVTLSACGADVPTGVDPDGRPVLSSGTSFATPQVVAAAAMLKSINPKLTAQQIKQILVDTAANEVDRDGTKTTVPDNVGGKVLRVDNAVLKVINDLRGPGNELTKDDLLALTNIKLVADGGPAEYTVTASITKANPGGTDLTITMMGEGMIDGTTSQHVAGPGEVSWQVLPTGENSTPTIRVVRSDTGGCAILVLETLDINGHWEGTFTFTDFQDNTASSGDAGGGSSDGLGGCDLSMIGEIVAKLLGRPLPMSMDIIADEEGHGTGVMTLDMSSVAAELAAENPDIEVSSTSEPLNLTLVYEEDTVTFNLSDAGASATMVGKVERQGDYLVMNGYLESNDTRVSMAATWSVTKE